MTKSMIHGARMMYHVTNMPHWLGADVHRLRLSNGPVMAAMTYHGYDNYDMVDMTISTGPIEREPCEEKQYLNIILRSKATQYTSRWELGY